MYKIVIVDDEKNIIEGLKKVIDWESIGCEIIGTAVNGLQGLQLIREEKPDIAIVDINMPHFDGLSLIKELSKEVSTKFIILSGYSNFEYAQKGIHYGVISYLLKPVEEADLIDALKKAIATIVDNHTVFDQITSLEKNYLNVQEKNRNFILKEFVNSYFESDNTAKLMIEEADITFSGPYYYVIVFQLISCTNIDQLSTQLRHYINEHFTRKYIVFNYSHDEIVLIYSSNHDILPVDLKSTVRNLLTNLIKNFQSSICCGISQPHKYLKEINKAFSEARFASIYMTLKVSGATSIYSASNDPTYNENQAISPALRSSLESSIKFLDYVSIKKYTNEIFLDIKKNSTFELVDMQLYSIHILMECMKKLYDMGIQYSEGTTELFIKITSLKDNEIIDNCIPLTTQFIEKFEEISRRAEFATQSRSKINIEEIKKYITENISQDLTLESISKIFFISPVYLSQLFKKESHQGYLDFVQDTKMKRACELLRHSDKMIYEIAELIGYKDQKHFSKVFEKRIGSTPSQYRRSVDISN